MSVTDHGSTIRSVGGAIVSTNDVSIWNNSKILGNRNKPVPALFSRKALNLEYTKHFRFERKGGDFAE